MSILTLHNDILAEILITIFAALPPHYSEMNAKIVGNYDRQLLLILRITCLISLSNNIKNLLLLRLVSKKFKYVFDEFLSGGKYNHFIKNKKLTCSGRIDKKYIVDFTGIISVKNLLSNINDIKEIINILKPISIGFKCYIDHIIKTDIIISIDEKHHNERRKKKIFLALRERTEWGNNANFVDVLTVDYYIGYYFTEFRKSIKITIDGENVTILNKNEDLFDRNTFNILTSIIMDFKKPENQINFCLEQNFGKYFGYNLNLESLLFSKYDEIINEYMISYFKNNKDKALYKEFFLFIVRDFVNSGRICK